MSDPKHTHTRRKFLAQTGRAAAGLVGVGMFGASCQGDATPASASKSGGQQVGPTRSDPARGATVVVARDPAVWDGDDLNPERLENLLFEAVRALTGAKDDAGAWGRFFSDTDRVGVKVNCLAGRRLSTTPELVHAMISGLTAAGVQKPNIAVFDRTTDELRQAGFKPSSAPDGVRVVGTDTQGVGYERELSLYGEVGSKVSRVVTRFSTALINAPVLKDHDLAGISGALKNYFGAIHNPNKMHLDGCDPYIADCYCLPEFKDKTRLCISDATLGQYHAGPGFKPSYAWKFSGVIVSDDPVALDAVCRDIIEKKRAENGLPTVEDEGRPARFIETAADESRGLGVANMDRITVRDITL